MTTRYKPTNLRALWAAMHEAGHGLTYQGVDPALGRTPLYGNASLGLGESQSRSWENLVGRSLPFWRGRYPKLQRRFPQLEQVELETWYRGINRVAPADPGRRRRGHLLAAHHPPLRAGAGAGGGRARARRPAGGVERADAGAARRRGARRRRGVLQDVHWTRAPTATSPPTRSGTRSPSRSGASSSRSCPTSTPSSRRASSAALRVAPRAALPARAQVHADGDAPARDRRRRDRPAAVPRVPARQGRARPASHDSGAEMEDVLLRVAGARRELRGLVALGAARGRRDLRRARPSRHRHRRDESATSTSWSPGRSGTGSRARSCSASTSPTGIRPSAPRTTARWRSRSARTGASCRSCGST